VAFSPRRLSSGEFPQVVCEFTRSFAAMRRWTRPLLLVLSCLLPPSLRVCLAGAEDAAHPSPPTLDLHRACLRGDVAAVRGHIAAGSDLDRKDAQGSTALVVAATFGQTASARALIEAGADLELRDAWGSAPLHLAALFGHQEIVQALLDKGARRRARNGSGSTAFDIVQAPLEVDRLLYDQVGSALKPLGLSLDYARIERTRPKLAEMLKATPQELGSARYAPAPGGDWQVSTPAAEGLDPALVAELYVDAAAVEKLRSLLVIRNGRLIAEGYFDGGARQHKELLQSVTKSVTSALVGIALEQGCLRSVDQKMLDFFPEQAGRIADPRKQRITVRHLLQMRGGYPWEETDPALWQALAKGDLLKLVADVRLANDPGTAFNYSNLSSHWLGVVVARACGTDLRSLAEERLFAPLQIQLGDWIRDADGYYVGLAEMHLRARDMAKLGQLYLDHGEYAGRRVLPAAWVDASLQSQSPDAWTAQPPQNHVGRYFRELGYGYQWWSAELAGRHVDFAWGHGGQLVVLLKDLAMVVVATSEPFYRRSDDVSWRHERATINLVGKFIRSLPR
jgi:CubicO group peptidase (beta-lactamase class C family)